jgi:hypothetical protein
MSSSSLLKEKVLFHLEQDDGYPPVAIEGIWTRLINGIHLVDNIPFYAYGVGPGDQISVKQDPEGLWFDKLIKPSGVSVFRVFIKDRNDIPAVRGALLDLSCPSEIDAQMGLIAIEIPVNVDLMPVLNYLMEGQETEKFDFEEGVLRHALPE